MIMVNKLFSVSVKMLQVIQKKRLASYKKIAVSVSFGYMRLALSQGPDFVLAASKKDCLVAGICVALIESGRSNDITEPTFLESSILRR